MIEMNNILAIVLLIGIVSVWFSFIKNLFKGIFGLDIIAGVALVSTLLAGQYLAGVVVLVMYVGGQFLEEYAMRRSKKELSLLLERNPHKAHKKNGDIFEDVEIGKIQPGDLVLVKPKEILTVDGMVEDGETTVNELVLSGESESVLKNK